MEDEQLHSELSEIIRAEFEPVLENQRAHQERLDRLSDEEWWEGRLKFVVENSPELAERMKGRKEEMIRQRHANPLPRMDEGTFVSTKVNEILPALIALRERQGIVGPVTLEQYRQASMDTSQHQIEEMSQKLHEAVSRQTDPLRKELISKFAENVKADQEDLKTLQDLSAVTEEQLAQVTANISQRFAELADVIKQHRDSRND